MKGAGQGGRAVSGDRAVQEAREYLAAIAKHSVAVLPPTVLAREAAELRLRLRQVLQVVEDFEDTERDEDVTAMTLWGGCHIAPADALTLASALADAVAYRAQLGDADDIAAYQDLSARLGTDHG
jgi:hypothetical protein